MDGAISKSGRRRRRRKKSSAGQSQGQNETAKRVAAAPKKTSPRSTRGGGSSGGGGGRKLQLTAREAAVVRDIIASQVFKSFSSSHLEEIVREFGLSYFDDRDVSLVGQIYDALIDKKKQAMLYGSTPPPYRASAGGGRTKSGTRRLHDDDDVDDEEEDDEDSDDEYSDEKVIETMSDRKLVAAGSRGGGHGHGHDSRGRHDEDDEDSFEEEAEESTEYDSDDAKMDSVKSTPGGRTTRGGGRRQQEDDPSDDEDEDEHDEEEEDEDSGVVEDSRRRPTSKKKSEALEVEIVVSELSEERKHGGSSIASGDVDDAGSESHSQSMPRKKRKRKRRKKKRKKTDLTEVLDRGSEDDDNDSDELDAAAVTEDKDEEDEEHLDELSPLQIVENEIGSFDPKTADKCVQLLKKWIAQLTMDDNFSATLIALKCAESLAQNIVLCESGYVSPTVAEGGASNLQPATATSTRSRRKGSKERTFQAMVSGLVNVFGYLIQGPRAYHEWLINSLFGLSESLRSFPKSKQSELRANFAAHLRKLIACQNIVLDDAQSATALSPKMEEEKDKSATVSQMAEDSSAGGSKAAATGGKRKRRRKKKKKSTSPQLTTGGSSTFRSGKRKGSISPMRVYSELLDAFGLDLTEEGGYDARDGGGGSRRRRHEREGGSSYPHVASRLSGLEKRASELSQSLEVLEEREKEMNNLRPTSSVEFKHAYASVESSISRKFDSIGAENKSLKAELAVINSEKAVYKELIEHKLYPMKQSCQSLDNELQRFEAEKANLEQRLTEVKQVIGSLKERQSSMTEEMEVMKKDYFPKEEVLNEQFNNLVFESKRKEKESALYQSLRAILVNCKGKLDEWSDRLILSHQSTSQGVVHTYLSRLYAYLECLHSLKLFISDRIDLCQKHISIESDKHKELPKYYGAHGYEMQQCRKEIDLWKSKIVADKAIRQRIEKQFSGALLRTQKLIESVTACGSSTAPTDGRQALYGGANIFNSFLAKVHATFGTTAGLSYASPSYSPSAGGGRVVAATGYDAHGGRGHSVGGVAHTAMAGMRTAPHSAGVGGGMVPPPRGSYPLTTSAPTVAGTSLGVSTMTAPPPTGGTLQSGAGAPAPPMAMSGTLVTAGAAATMATMTAASAQAVGGGKYFGQSHPHYAATSASPSALFAAQSAMAAATQMRPPPRTHMTVFPQTAHRAPPTSSKPKAAAPGTGVDSRRRRSNPPTEQLFRITHYGMPPVAAAATSQTYQSHH